RELRRSETERLLRTPIPELGTPFNEILDEVVDDVFPNITHTDHPRFYSFVPSPINFVSVMGDLLATGHNVFAGHWLSSSSAAQIELIVLDWLKEMCGLPADAGGTLVSGGSMANLSAIATAREIKLGGPDATAVVYCSDQTHSSLSKGLRVIGFGRNQRRVVDTDEALRLSMPALEAAVAADRAAGLKPFVVVANAGTTNTGAVDPIPAIADLCEREGMWLHVDGAYGAASAITTRGRALLPGLERADSITLDPHKWLFQPYEVGCLLVRDARHLQRAFRVHDDDHADYLVDVMAHHEGEVNFFERGIQLTRSFSALKLWMSLRTFGLAEFRRAIDVGLDLAEHTERCLRLDSRWEIVTPAQLGVVTFRWRGDGMSLEDADAVMRRVVKDMTADGYALVLSTVLKGLSVLRICPMHPGGTNEEIEETIRRLTIFAESAAVVA
ncbi:MAG: aminotransferase class I/II-fold pyridoxal phosphate-dependent enzyme, partial [Gemmatimonadaceae bacterium]